jgi:hypothetical protein
MQPETEIILYHSHLGYARRVCPFWDVLDPVIGGQEAQTAQFYQLANSKQSSDTELTNTT